MYAKLLIVVSIVFMCCTTFAEDSAANDNHKRLIKLGSVTLTRTFPTPIPRIGLGDDGTVYVTAIANDGQRRLVSVSQPGVGVELIHFQGQSYLLDNQKQLLAFQPSIIGWLRSRLHNFSRVLRPPFNTTTEAEDPRVQEGGDFFNNVVATHVEEITQKPDNDFLILTRDETGFFRQFLLSDVTAGARSSDCVRHLSKLMMFR